MKEFYLHTYNISFERIPRLNIVHQIVRDLEISMSFSHHLMMQIKYLSLIFINIYDSLFDYCSCWPFSSKFLSINVLRFVILSIAVVVF